MFDIALSISFFMFLTAYLYNGVLDSCRYLILPSFKQDVLVRNVYFSPMRSVNVAIKQ